MEEQSAREPLLDVGKLEPVEALQIQDGIHEQNGRLLCGVFRTYIVCASYFL
jgi:hypothetical protein